MKIEASIFAASSPSTLDLETQCHHSPRAAVVHHDHEPLLRWPRYIAGSVQCKHSKSPPSSFFHPTQAHAIDKNIAIPRTSDEQLSMQKKEQNWQADAPQKKSEV